MTEREEQQPAQDVFNPDEFMGTGAPPADESDSAPTPPPPTPPPPSDQVQFDEYWGAMQEEGVELGPELIEVFKSGKDAEGNPLTPRAKLNMLKDFMMDNILLGGNEEHDAFIREYMTAANQEGFNRSEWLKNKQASADFINMPSKDFLKTYYKRHSEVNKLNWKDEDINSKVDGMNIIDADMEAQRVKAYLQQQMAEGQKRATQENMAKYEKQINENLTKTNDSIKKDITTFIATAQTKKSIGGFELGEADKKAFLDELPGFVEKKIVDLGHGKFIASDADLVLEEIKAKPEMSLNMLPFLWLIKHNKLEGLMSRIIEGKKKQLEETLDDTPGSQANRGGGSQPGFNPDQFMGGQA